MTPTKRRLEQIANGGDDSNDDGSPLVLEARKPKADAEAKGKGKGKGKVPRGYAPPEVYAHLKNTPDHLMVGLRGMSCHHLCMYTGMCRALNRQ